MKLLSPADKNYLVLLACCTLISIGLQWGGEALQIGLRYSRPDILEGQWWRLFSGQFLHVGWVHLVMNLVAALLLVLFLDRSRSMLYWLFVWMTCLLGAGLGLFFFSPQVLWYVGLSGALHGVFAAALFDSLRAGQKIELRLLLLAMIAKVSWEQWAGAMPGSAASIGAPVIVDAHFYGLITGLLLGLMGWLWQRRFSSQAE